MPELLKVALQVAFWCFLGVVILGSAFWVNDAQWGNILLWLGMLVGYTGMTVTLWRAYLRAEERGDF